MDEKKLIRELREQVSSLSAAAHLLTPLVQDHGTDRDMECLSAMNRDLYQLVRTIRHMELCFAQAGEVRMGLVDAAGLCRDLGRGVEAAAKELGVEFTWRLERESLITLMDEDMVVQAVLNMLSNAFQAAGPGGRVSLRCADGNGRCTITVGDSGEGLRPRDGSEDPLLKGPEGLGLGLEGARRAASLHGGTLVLGGSKEGVQATFSLPIRKPKESDKLRDGTMCWDRTGGFSPLMVEFSTLLPLSCFRPESIE